MLDDVRSIMLDNINKFRSSIIELGEVVAEELWIFKLLDHMEGILRLRALGYSRGHAIGYDLEKEEWYYYDTLEPIDEYRECKRCGRIPTSEGYDNCIGHIDGAKSVCCGHGVIEPILVMEEDEKEN